MVQPTPEEQLAAERAGAARAAKQFKQAVAILQYLRVSADSPFLRRQAAYALGAGVEYRLQVAEGFQISPPKDVLERLLDELDDAVALDETIADLHWDRAVIHARFTGNFAKADAAFLRALELGLSHPLIPALQRILESKLPPEAREDSASYRLRELFFRLVDTTADGTIPEFAPSVGDESLPFSYADYIERAESIVHAAPLNAPADVAQLYECWSRLSEQRIITADPYDYGSEMMFRAAAATTDTELAAQALAALAAHLRDFSFHVSGGDPDASDLRKARRIARRGLDLVAGTDVPIDADLHGDLWLALGQSSARPADLRLDEAFEGYTRALQLKRGAGNDGDVERLTDLLNRMIHFAVQQRVGASLGFVGLGAARAEMQAAYAASKIIGDMEAMHSIGLEYVWLLSALSQPFEAIDVLDELLVETGLSDEQRFDLLFEKAMRLSEARQPSAAAAIQEALMDDLVGQSDRTLCIFWNAYSNVLRELELYDSALDAVNRALDYCPESEDDSVDALGPMLHTNRGLILLALDRVEDAERSAAISSEIAARLPRGDAVMRIGELRTRVALEKGDYPRAVLECGKAIDSLQDRITKGDADLSVWQSMLQEWSRFDGMGLQARVKNQAPPEECLAFAESAKGRIMRFGRGMADGIDPKLALTPATLAPLVERVRTWACETDGRWVVSLFCSSQGIAIFCIGGDRTARTHWLDGPVYDRFRDECYDSWEDLTDWALDRELQSAASRVGAPAELVLSSAQAMSELLLDKIGALLHDAVPELAAGGRELVIIPHRCFRSLPLAHARLPGGEYLSELFDQVTTAATLDILADLLEPDIDGTVRLDAFLDPQDNLPFARLEGAIGFASSRRTGWQATRRELLRSLESPGQVLISAHSDFVEENPFASWLAMHDGHLSFADILQQGTAQKSLVILSSCEAGRMQRSNSDEPFGFPAMLHEVGVAGVIAPCWRVDDFPTFLLMSRLQENLVNGDTPAAALCRASHWLRRLNARATLDRIDALAQKVRERAFDDATDRALEDLDEQRQWLKDAFVGTERPFSAPFFWAGFQFSGAPF